MKLCCFTVRTYTQFKLNLRALGFRGGKKKEKERKKKEERKRRKRSLKVKRKEEEVRKTETCKGPARWRVGSLAAAAARAPP